MVAAFLVPVAANNDHNQGFLLRDRFMEEVSARVTTTTRHQQPIILHSWCTILVLHTAQADHEDILSPAWL